MRPGGPAVRRVSLEEDERLPPGGRTTWSLRWDRGTSASHDGTSRLCYFLDGVQSSREIGRIEMSPVIVATVAAAIVNRCERRFSRMPLESPPVVVQAVILPRSAGDAGVEAFWELLLAAGFSELGPDEVPSSPHLVLDSAEYIAEADPSDYVGMRERARVRVTERSGSGWREACCGQWEGDDRVLETPTPGSRSTGSSGHPGVQPARHRPHKERGPSRVRGQRRRDAARPGAGDADDQLRPGLAAQARA